MLPGSPIAQTGPCSSSRVTIARSLVPSSNSAITARLISPSSTGSERSSTLASRREQIEQVSGQPPEATRLGPGAVQQRARILEIGLLVAQVIIEQLQHPVQGGQRRAQLVRCGGDE